MAKKGSVLATLLLIAIVLVLFWGALNSGPVGGGGEGEGGSGGLLGLRLPFVTWVLVFLAFVAGFGLRDSVARWLQNRPRPEGRKPA